MGKELCAESARKSGRQLKKLLLAALAMHDWVQEVKNFGVDPQRLICPLFSTLLNSDPVIRWHAVSCFGLVVPELAEQSLERARVVMRRFIWNLTDESGGIGWGAPEAMAECIATHQGLAREYHSILCSYILELDGPDNYLEYTPLRQGAFWAVARVAQARPDYAQQAGPALVHALKNEQDFLILGLASLALGLLKGPKALENTSFLKQESVALNIYWNHNFRQTSVQELALVGENILKWKSG